MLSLFLIRVLAIAQFDRFKGKSGGGQKKILKQINVYIDILIPKCETFNATNHPISNFKKIINQFLVIRG